jgi:LAO/AO transport system kinase
LATDEPADLVERARTGERAALARLLSLIERGGEAAREVSRICFPLSGTAYTVGITGAPGSGKSTLTGRLIRGLRAGGAEVGVLAVDPSSPFSGGAILGDRVRMQDHALDNGVFIRSMATRGHLGGLALATPEAERALDAAGFEWVLVETVGVGQVEVEVAGATDTTLVVVNPGWGDAVQASKAGLLEVADVFVVNKADRPGVEETRRDLEQMLDLSGHPAWRAPVVACVASTGDGVDGVLEAVASHREYQQTSGQLERRRAGRLADELGQVVAERLRQKALDLLKGDALDGLRSDVLERRVDPWSAADQIIRFLNSS